MWVAVMGASVAMLAAGWRAGTATADGLTVADPGAGTTGQGAVPAVSPTPIDPTTGGTTTGTITTPAEPAPPAGPSGTFVGASVSNSYGSFQVQIVVRDGTITDVQPLVIGLGDSTSRAINQDAVPTLEARVLDAQSASVSYVSGASYTSQGYLGSVADAIANAGI